MSLGVKVEECGPQHVSSKEHRHDDLPSGRQITSYYQRECTRVIKELPSPAEPASDASITFPTLRRERGGAADAPELKAELAQLSRSKIKDTVPIARSLLLRGLLMPQTHDFCS